MLTKNQFTSLMSLVIVACNTASKTELSQQNSAASENPVSIFTLFGKNLVDFACPTGQTLTDFGIGGSLDLELRGNPMVPSDPENPVRPAANTIIHFCANFDELKFSLVALNQVAPSMGMGVSPMGHGLKVTKSVDASSFTQAMEQGDWSLIDVKFENTEDPSTSIWFKGWKDEAGSPYVTLSAYDAKEGNPLKVSSNPDRFFGRSIQKGTIVERNPAKEVKTCSTAELKLNSGLISYDFCWEGNRGRGFQYEFSRLSIKDNSTNLSSPISLDLSKEDLDQHMKIDLTHHGLTDQFVFKTSQSTYTLNTAGKLLIQYKNNNAREEVIIPCSESHVTQCGILP